MLTRRNFLQSTVAFAAIAALPAMANNHSGRFTAWVEYPLGVFTCVAVDGRPSVRIPNNIPVGARFSVRILDRNAGGVSLLDGKPLQALNHYRLWKEA